MFWSAGCSLLRAESFFCCLDALYGGLGIGKFKFLIKKILNFFFCVKFVKFWSSKPWIRIGIQPKMLDPDPESMNPDPESMNPDPKHCKVGSEPACYGKRPSKIIYGRHNQRSSQHTLARQKRYKNILHVHRHWRPHNFAGHQEKKFQPSAIDHSRHNWVPPTPLPLHPQACCFSLLSKGKTHSLAGVRGWGDPIRKFRLRDRHFGTICIL